MQRFTLLLCATTGLAGMEPGVDELLRIQYIRLVFWGLILRYALDQSMICVCPPNMLKSRTKHNMIPHICLLAANTLANDTYQIPS
jgi:hypothetical protein